MIKENKQEINFKALAFKLKHIPPSCVSLCHVGLSHFFMGRDDEEAWTAYRAETQPLPYNGGAQLLTESGSLATKEGDHLPIHVQPSCMM